ncbi:hypothetical protein GCM10010435_95610 [Winogradskya consettensis]|uniref:Lipoprotein n=1 Tax=Winogradskya consettensis TaxID=113560 RepID=A0A919SXK3_9ACTN|nr:hypothetical protein [Actinoplanes consettensis]GIM79859.1 hypothetical protein Aco04nite_67660 [Actinoplanes consettensis]
MTGMVRWTYAERAAGVAAAGLIATGLVFVGCASGDDGSAAPPESSAIEGRSLDAVGPACGEPWQFNPGDLTVTATFPTGAPAGPQPVAGEVEVTSRAAVRGVAGPAADVFVVRDGLIVTMPMAQDAVGVRWELAAGQARTLPAQLVPLSCAPGGEALPPGSYQLYARVVLIPDDGTPQTSYGGPWPFEIR